MKLELRERKDGMPECTEIRIYTDSGRFLAEDTFLYTGLERDKGRLRACVSAALYKRGIIHASKLDSIARQFRSVASVVLDNMYRIKIEGNAGNDDASTMYFRKISGTNNLYEQISEETAQEEIRQASERR